MLHMHDSLNFETSHKTGLPEGFRFRAPVFEIGPSGDRPRHRAHEHAALANALDEGLMADEVAQILAGRSISDVFPVGRNESPADYAARAVAEMFVAYLQ